MNVLTWGEGKAGLGLPARASTQVTGGTCCGLHKLLLLWVGRGWGGWGGNRVWFSRHVTRLARPVPGNIGYSTVLACWRQAEGIPHLKRVWGREQDYGRVALKGREKSMSAEQTTTVCRFLRLWVALLYVQGSDEAGNLGIRNYILSSPCSARKEISCEVAETGVAVTTIVAKQQQL